MFVTVLSVTVLGKGPKKFSTKDSNVRGIRVCEDPEALPSGIEGFLGERAWEMGYSGSKCLPGTMFPPQLSPMNPGFIYSVLYYIVRIVMFDPGLMTRSVRQGAAVTASPLSRCP